MNYDCVLENAKDYINTHHQVDAPLEFYPKAVAGSQPGEGVLLAKLHGSIDTEIVPPTWNKKIHDKILPFWRAAFKAVAEANELRFIGYSLPETDSYFRFFLKAAISQSFNLQRVDVLCAGTDVPSRYRELFEPNRLHFNPGTTEMYLTSIAKFVEAGFGTNNRNIDLQSLENAHQRTFQGQ
jgi:hypothetical protein